MKTPSLIRSTLAVLAGLCACLIAGQTAFAASVLWSGATDDNWSTPGNWSGGTPAGNEIVFGNLDATGGSGPFGTVNNIVDSSLAISRLSYTNLTTVGFHTTQIPLSVSLTVTNSGNTILVNAPGDIPAGVVYATVLGTGALSLTNTAGVISIGQGSATANATRRATLDLSGLDTFNAALGRIIIGQQTAHGNRANGTLLLAKTNFIDLAGTPGVLLGENTSNNGNDQTLGLGVTNVILSDSGLTIGGRKGNGNLRFNSALVSVGSGSALFRARNGTGRQTQWLVGDNSAQTGTTTSAGTVDFATYGSVDALVDAMILGRGTPSGGGAGASQGTLKFDAGTVDVNKLLLGVIPGVNGGSAVGTVNVDGTGQLIVNNNLQLGYTPVGTTTVGVYSRGLLNIGSISGGSVTVKGDVVCAGGSGNKITSFGALTLGGKLGDTVSATNTPLETLDLWSGSVTFARGNAGLPATPLVQVTNLNVNGSVSVNVTGSAFALGQFPLFKYYSGVGDVGGGSGFGGLTLTLPGNVAGYLSNNTANASVDLVITDLIIRKWSGIANSNWDINATTNWINFYSGISAKYLQPSVPGDTVLFDDSATGTTTVNLTTTLAPDGIRVTNVTKTYTFNGTGALSGPTGITKQGAGTLILGNSGTNNFSASVVIEGGTVRLAGSADRVPTNGTVTLSNVAGATLDLNGLNQEIAVLNGGGAVGGNVSLGAGNLTVNGAGGSYAGVISGGGAVIKSGSGTQVLSGANGHTGGIQVQDGTLTLANTTGSGAGSGSVSVAANTNATLRLGDGGANGSVAAGTIANDGLVVLNRSDDLTFTTLITGNGTFRKENTNTVTIPISNTYTGTNLTVAAGALRLSNAGALGDTNGVLAIESVATARLELTGNLLLLEPLALSMKGGAAGYAPGVLNISGANTLAGPISLNAGGTYWIIASDAGKLVVSGAITNTTTSNLRWLWLSGAADGEWNTDLPNGTAPSYSALRKDGVGTWKLGSTVTYTGQTAVNNGTLVVNGTIANSSSVTNAGGTLAGTGSILAPVVVQAAGNLAPGDGGIGTLSVSNLTLNGTTTMELAKTGPTATNDQVRVLNTLTLGGTLNVSLTGTVTGGEVFQLFTAGTIAPSAFSATNLPALPGGLTWDTSNLGTGTLVVSGAVSLPPAIPLNVVQSGNVLTFSWTNAAFRLQSQTNSLAEGLKTNWFDYPGGGTSPVLVTNNPANPTVFFRLITP